MWKYYVKHVKIYLNNYPLRMQEEADVKNVVKKDIQKDK